MEYQIMLLTITSSIIGYISGQKMGNNSSCMQPPKLSPIPCRSKQRNICSFPPYAGRGVDWNFFPRRNCFCDDLCSVYGDCCSDHSQNTTLKDPLPEATFQCAPIKGVFSYGLDVLLVNKCPHTFEDDKIKSLCEDDTGDIFMNWPVSGKHTGILYKNVFCSRCHQEPDVTYWISNFTCPNARANKDEGNVVEIIKSLTDTGECFTNFSHPTDYPFGYRLCKPNIDTCSLSYTDKCVRELCEGPESETSYVYHNHQTTYKNSYCAYCNGKTVGLKCFDKVSKIPPLLISGEAPPYEIFPLSLVLDLNTGTGRVLDYRVGQKSGPPIKETNTTIYTCPEKQVYDPFTAQCRAVFCSKGEYLEDNKCIGGASNESCRYMFLYQNEYIMYDNGSMYVFLHKQMYNPGSYQMLGGNVSICTDLSQNYTMNITIIRHASVTKFSEEQSIVSAIGQVLSIIALSIHFTVYLILPTLRNLPGKNLMSLVFALFWAQFLFLVGVGPAAPEIRAACAFIGAVIHYFFLASFCWMNVMAYDIWRTFSSKTLRHDKEEAFKYFIGYSVYAWVTPFAIVLIAIIIDNSPVEEAFQPGYGKVLCWISSRVALLLFFALPLAILLLVNIFLYVMTVHNIYTVSRTTRMVKQESSDKQRFFLYVKLSFIMGLTWIFGFIAASTDTPFLWYVFIVLNTMQGLFICITFVCTKKVFKLLKERYQKKYGGEDSTKSSSTTKRTSLSSETHHQVKTGGKRSASITSDAQHCTKSLLKDSK